MVALCTFLVFSSLMLGKHDTLVVQGTFLHK